MNSENRFYVYVHRYASGPKKGEVFYVGKGHKSRVYSSQGRSKWWNAIVRKYGKKNEFVARGMNCSCALTLERIIISRIGMANLCNLTKGGEGMHGYKHSESAKEKISNSNRTRIVSEKTRMLFSERSKGRPKSDRARQGARERMVGNKLRLGVSFSKETIAHLSSVRTGPKHHNFDHEQKTFIHNDGPRFFGTMYDFCQKYFICRKAMSAVNTGRRRHHSGWKIVRQIHENQD